jgi:hypothetical protein
MCGSDAAPREDVIAPGAAFCPRTAPRWMTPFCVIDAMRDIFRLPASDDVLMLFMF